VVLVGSRAVVTGKRLVLVSSGCLAAAVVVEEALDVVVPVVVAILSVVVAVGREITLVRVPLREVVGGDELGTVVHESEEGGDGVGSRGWGPVVVVVALVRAEAVLDGVAADVVDDVVLLDVAAVGMGVGGPELALPPVTVLLVVLAAPTVVLLGEPAPVVLGPVVLAVEPVVVAPDVVVLVVVPVVVVDEEDVVVAAGVVVVVDVVVEAPASVVVVVDAVVVAGSEVVSASAAPGRDAVRTNSGKASATIAPPQAAPSLGSRRLDLSEDQVIPAPTFAHRQQPTSGGPPADPILPLGSSSSQPGD
jgi:hypothetical protein